MAIDVLITPLSGTIYISGSEAQTPTPPNLTNGSNYLWASGTNLHWGSNEVYTNAPGTSEITGGGAADQVAYFSAASNITGSSNLTFDGTKFSSNVKIADDKKLLLGDSSDLQLYHSAGASSYFTNGSNALIIWNQDAAGGQLKLRNDREDYGIVFDVSGTEVARAVRVNGSEGRIGIGTTAPSYPLHVVRAQGGYAAQFEASGNNGDVMRLRSTGDGSTLRFQTDHIIPSQALHIGNDNANIYFRTTGYKVGIATSSPTQMLDVRGNIFASGGTRGALIQPTYSVAGDNTYSTLFGSEGLMLGTTGDAYVDVWNTGGRYTRFRHATGSTTDGAMTYVTGAVADTEFFRIKPTGTNYQKDAYLYATRHVTLASAENLQLDSNANMTLTYDGEFNIYNDQGTAAMVTFRSGTQAAMEFEADNDIQFKNNTTNLMKIASDGDVGIGTTAPDQKLDVRGNMQLKTTSNTNVAYIGDANRSGADSSISAFQGFWNGTKVADMLIVSGDDTTNKDNGEFVFRTATAGTVAERLRITDDGNVGIGTASPGKLLHIDSDTTGDVEVLRLENSNASTTSIDSVTQSFRLRRDQDDYSYHAAKLTAVKEQGWTNSAATVDASLTFSTIQNETTSEKMRINSAGNVGIGTVAPEEQLHLTGDMIVGGGDILFGTTDKVKFKRGGTNYFQMLTSGNSAAGLQSLGLLASNSYGSTPQRGTITLQQLDHANKPTSAGGYGFLWVSGSVPNKIYFTDGSGTSFDLTETGSGGGGTIGGSIAEDRIAVGTSTANTITGTSKFEWDDATLKMTNAGDTAITLLGDANRSSENSHVMAMRGKWDGTVIGTMMIASGPDTTNKDDGQLLFYTAAGGTQAERMRIDETGNVGIGTGSPEKTLHVKSAGTSGVKIQTSDASSYAQLQFTSPNTGYSLINFGDGDASSPGYIQYTHSSDLMLLKATKTIELKGASAAGYINFSTDNTERMRIKGDGDITIASGSTLWFNDAGTAPGTLRLRALDGNTMVSGATDLHLVASDDISLKTGGGSGIITMSPDSAELVRLHGTNAMIGTPTALDTSKLTIVDTSNPQLALSYDGGDYATLKVDSSGVLTVATNMAAAGVADRFKFDGNHFRGTDTNGPSMRNETPSSTNPVFTFNNDVDTGMSRAAANELSLITQGAEAMRIDADGLIGINTGSPTDLLTIQGDTNASTQIGAYAYSATDDKTAKIFLNKSANSTAGSHTAVANGDYLGLLAFRGSDGDSFEIGAQIRAQATQDFGAAARGTDLIFSTVDNSTTALDDRMAITQDGKVGIGLTNPSEFVHIKHASTNSLLLLESGDNIASLRIKDPSSTKFINSDGGILSMGAQSSANAANLNILTDGKVGIGTTEPGFPFVVSGTQYDMAKIASSHSAGACLYLDADATGGSNWHLQSTANGAGTGGGKLDFVDNGTSRMVIDSAGDVGIGTTNPIQPLHVLTSANDKGILIDVGDDAHEGRLLFGDTSSNAIGHIGYNHSLETMRFTIGGYETVRMANDGSYSKLFLGGDSTLGLYRYSNRMDFYISSNPRIHLDASKLYSATSGGPLLDLTPTTGEANYGFVDDADSGLTRSAANTIHLLTAGVSGMTMDSSQNVGIGETSPVRKLDVNSAGIDIVSRFTSTDNRATIQLSDDDTNRYINTENSAISLGPNSSLHSNNLNIVGSPAKVGIGTTGPTQALDVRGNIVVTDNNKIMAGSGEDLRFFHDGTDSVIQNVEGDFYLKNTTTDKDIIFITDQGGTDKETMRIDGSTQGVTAAGTLLVSGNTTLEGNLLSVNKAIKQDIVANYTVSTDYSHYMVTGDGNDPSTGGTTVVTMPTGPQVGDEYWIISQTTGNPIHGTAGNVTIKAGTGGTINGVAHTSTINISHPNSAASFAYKIAHIICVDGDTWVMSVSDQCPT